MKKVNILLGFIAVVVLTSCGATRKASSATITKKLNLAPVTAQLLKEYDLLNPVNRSKVIKKLQFYSDADSIILEKEFVVKSASASPKGKLLIKNQDDLLDRIVIYPNTPGICLRIDSAGVFDITFSDDNKNYLTFGPSKYDAEHTYVMYNIDGPAVQYGRYNTTYNIVSGYKIYLMVDIEGLKAQGFKKIEPGRRIGVR